MNQGRGYHILFGVTLLALLALGAWWTIFFMRSVEMEKLAAMEQAAPPCRTGRATRLGCCRDAAGHRAADRRSAAGGDPAAGAETTATSP